MIEIKLVAALILEYLLDQYNDKQQFKELLKQVSVDYEEALAAYPDINVFYNQVAGRLTEYYTLLNQETSLEQQLADVRSQMVNI